MHTRMFALVGALALAACQHGAKERPVAQAPDASTSGQAAGGQNTQTTTPDDSVVQGSTGTGVEGETAPGQAAETDAYGQTGTGSGAAHADDKIVSGTVRSFSSKTIAIQDANGKTTTLSIVPETLIEGSGSAQISEGQQVRAAYNTVQGKDVAVRIQTGGSTDMGTGSGGTSTTDPMDPSTRGTTEPTPGTTNPSSPDPSGDTSGTTPPVQQTPPSSGSGRP